MSNYKYIISFYDSEKTLSGYFGEDLLYEVLNLVYNLEFIKDINITLVEN